MRLHAIYSQDIYAGGGSDPEALKTQEILEALESGTALFWIMVGTLSVAAVGLADYLAGNEINLSLFYLVPIVLATWSVNFRAGLFISFLSTLSWLVAEYAAGHQYSHPFIYFWNTVIRFGFFVILTFLVAALRRSRREELLAARTDFVSGAINRRYFDELLQMEINRIRRYPHPVTVAYIDIDNFKLVNDLFGHKMGDEVLRCIANELKSQLRSTDIIARVGGDEFALLLPSAHQTAAETVISKVRVHLREEMKSRNLPVTFSMGVVTCMAPPHSAEQIINMADELMYEVKKSTKNGVLFGSWSGSRFGRNGPVRSS